ncbi:MAG: MBL fold metallo-hydrolase [Gemmatimonadetes bacterium]|nr:MBL fold metallo-hydrolase [Gemmatimonadota bacterium]
MTRSVLAANPSLFTLDGTRTYLVGAERVAVIDPGPSLPQHVDAVARAVGRAEVVALLLSHQHPDHAGGAAALAGRLRAPVLALGDGSLEPGGRIETDAGELLAIATPGHTRDHAAFLWPAEGAVFCGDLLMGGEETTLVAPPEGDLGTYLESLERVRRLASRVIYPAHGPPLTDPAAALRAYVRHREERQAQVLRALGRGPALAPALVDAVYGEQLDARLRAAAEGAVLAYLQHLEQKGLVRRDPLHGWRLV